MCPTNTIAPQYREGESLERANNGVASALQYRLPVLREHPGCCYIEFYAFDPEQGKLRRKKIKINRIGGVIKRRKYAREVITRLSEQLSNGWNPWIAKGVADLQLINEALTQYENHVERMMSGGYYRKETYSGYKSYLKMLRNYIEKYKRITYVYQFDRKFCVAFLDYIFIDRNNSAQTRNNYLNFLKVLSGFLVEKSFLQSRPTEGIAPISRRLFSKGRTCIPLKVIEKIAEHCKSHDPDFLLVCYLLYYCFIRPVEITRLKVRNFNLQEGTITIPAECSKNHREQTVTVPSRVLQYAIERGLFSAPMDDFIFSVGLRPGSVEIDPKIFRDHWAKLKKPLRLRKEWKFYSLKDTGITAMLKSNVAPITVRDQARHSSLAITELYTDHATNAVPEIQQLDGAL